MNPTRSQVLALGTNPRRLHRLTFGQLHYRHKQVVPARLVSGGDYGMGGATAQDLTQRDAYVIYKVTYLVSKRRLLHIPGVNSRNVLKVREIAITEGQYAMLHGLPERMD